MENVRRELSDEQLGQLVQRRAVVASRLELTRQLETERRQNQDEIARAAAPLIERRELPAFNTFIKATADKAIPHVRALLEIMAEVKAENVAARTDVRELLRIGAIERPADNPIIDRWMTGTLVHALARAMSLELKAEGVDRSDHEWLTDLVDRSVA